MSRTTVERAREVEFRIPISPTAPFYSNIKLFAQSLAKLGEPYSRARILLTIGDFADAEQVWSEIPWARDIPIDIRIVPFDRFEAYGYYATGQERFAEPPAADVVIICDADICIVRRMDEMIAKLISSGPAVAGLQAHLFPPNRSAKKCEALWARFFAAADLPLSLTQRYSLDAEGKYGLAPPYFNYGFVAMNRAGFNALAPIIDHYTRLAHEVAPYNVFKGQVGFALAVQKAELEVVQLSHAYNCANDDRVFDNGLDSEDDIRVLHYMRADEFDRHQFMVSPEAFAAFIGKPKTSRTTEFFRRHVQSLGAVVAPQAD